MTNKTTNFAKFLWQNCHTKTHVSILMYFQEEMVHLFFPKRKSSATKNKIHKNIFYPSYSV